KRVLISRDRLLALPRLQQGDPEIVGRVGEARLDLECATVVLDRAGQMAGRGERVRQVVMRARMAGPQLERASVVGERGLSPAAGGFGVGQIESGFEIIRAQAQRSLVLGDRTGGIAVRIEEVAEVV